MYIKIFVFIISRVIQCVALENAQSSEHSSIPQNID